jgi:hypothetical protein
MLDALSYQHPQCELSEIMANARLDSLNSRFPARKTSVEAKRRQWEHALDQGRDVTYWLHLKRVASDPPVPAGT